MRWDACRGWQAFPHASDACDRDGSLLLLKSIAHPKGTRQVESVSADGVGRYAPPQRPAAQCGLRISAPPHGRPVKPHHIQLWSPSASCSPSPQKARACLPPPTPGRLPPRREESWCAGERQKARHIRAFHGKKGIGGPLTDKNAGRSRTRIWRAKAPTAICGFESSSGNPRTRNASAPETPSSTTSKATPRCLASKRSSPPRRLHWEPLRSQASPTGLGFAPGPRPRCRDNTTTRAQVWRRPLSYVRAPARGSTPPLPMQRSTAAPSPTRRHSAPAPGLKTTTAFRPSPPANALRLRRPVAVLRRRQSAAQLYAVVDLYTAIWFVTRMRRLTGADSAQHDLLTISRTWISASVSSEQWGHVSQWRRRRAAASRGI